MRWFLITLAVCGNLSAAQLAGHQHVVYLLPMNHSLDQYLANYLIRMPGFSVVTDPARADIVMTDQVGATLEERLKKLYPPPPEPKPKEAPKEESKAKQDEARHDEAADSSAAALLAEAAGKAPPPGAMAVGSRGRGTIFLVDLHSRQVLWSTFERPKSYTARDLDRAAERIVKVLQKDLTPKEPKAPSEPITQQ
jgi:hypothetical protein